MLVIKVGSQAKVGPNQAPLDEDTILVRGPSAEVDRAIKEILQAAEDAKENLTASSYVRFFDSSLFCWILSLMAGFPFQVTQFEIDQEYVSRVVGAQGSAINKIRDSLGVRIDFDDEGYDKDADKSKRKKSSAKSKVKVR